MVVQGSPTVTQEVESLLRCLRPWLACCHPGSHWQLRRWISSQDHFHSQLFIETLGHFFGGFIHRNVGVVPA